jgi:hypothetical protein
LRVRVRMCEHTRVCTTEGDLRVRVPSASPPVLPLCEHGYRRLRRRGAIVAVCPFRVLLRWATQVAKREEIARSLAGESTAIRSPMTSKGDGLRRLLSAGGSAAIAELSRYEAAFIRVGLSPADVTAESVLAACRQQVRRRAVRVFMGFRGGD